MQCAPRILTIALLAVTITGCGSLQQTDPDNWTGYTETGQASFYAAKHQLKRTASGEPYRQELNTAAHKKLPFGCRVRVTNVKNGKSVIARVNDRGPHVKGRIIDLSRSAFSSIASLSSGLATVRIEVIE